MRNKHILMITLSLLLLVQPFISKDVTLAQVMRFENTTAIASSEITAVKQDIGLSGEEYIKTNFVHNPGFEYTDTYGGPGDSNYYNSPIQYSDEVYTANTHSGTYACRIFGQGNAQQMSYAYAYRSVEYVPYAYLSEGIELNFWYFLVANPDIASGGRIYLRLYFYTPSGNRYLYYYFSTSYVPANSSSNRGDYDLTGSSPFSAWNQFQRNITQDYEARFGAINPNIYLRYLYFYAESPNGATGLVDCIVDDFSLENSVAYEWLSDNGDFEYGDGSYWSGTNYGNGYVSLTADHTEGSKALNLTSYATIDNSYGQSSLYSYFSGSWNYPGGGLYPNQPGDVSFGFDWKYNDYNHDTENYAYVSVSGYNGTYSFELYFYLGYYSDIVPNYNSSNPTYRYVYLGVPGFGTRDTWNSLNIDLYDYYSVFNITNMPLVDISINVHAGYNQGARTELLIDNYNIIGDPVGDPGFEEDWLYTYDNPIPSWFLNTNENYISFSPNSHSGDNSANISSYNSAGQIRIYRDTFLPIGDNLYTDIWWNIDKLDAISNSYVQVYFELDNNYYLNYLFGAGSLFSTTNTSSSYYYYASDFNQLSTWNHFERNIAADVVTSFGAGNWNITEVRFFVYGSGTAMNTLLVDDVHFVRDTHGPELISQNLINTPTYYNNAIMQILARDYFTRVSFVQVFYRQGTVWNSVVASMEGMYFVASIPSQNWGTPVEYYFVMRDSMSLETTDNNGGSYYTYEIADDIQPFVAVLGVTTNENYGLAEINLACADEGSGIDHIEIFDNDASMTNLTTAPYTYLWDSSIVQPSGLHTIRVTAYDHAGNVAETTYNITVGVYEPPGPFVSFFHNWGTLVGAGIVGIAWGTFTIVKAVRKPKT